MDFGRLFLFLMRVKCPDPQSSSGRMMALEFDLPIIIPASLKTKASPDCTSLTHTLLGVKVVKEGAEPPKNVLKSGGWHCLSQQFSWRDY